MDSLKMQKNILITDAGISTVVHDGDVSVSLFHTQLKLTKKYD